MQIPTPHFHPKPHPEPAAMVRNAAREDVQWDRPIFKAPPLELQLRAFNAEILVEELRRIGLVQR